MQARPGPKKKQKAGTVPQSFTAPPVPANLTESQLETWHELCRNPYITNQDKTLIYEYIKTVALRDIAFEAMTRDGIFVDDAKGSIKTHPSYKVYRDASERVLKMHEMFLMTPRSRVQLAALSQPEDEDALAAFMG